MKAEKSKKEGDIFEAKKEAYEPSELRKDVKTVQKLRGEVERAKRVLSATHHPATQPPTIQRPQPPTLPYLDKRNWFVPPDRSFICSRGS